MDRDIRAGAIVLGFGFFGVIFSAMLYIMYERGIYVDEMLSASFPIAELMTVIVILFLLIGVVVAMLKS